MINVTMMNRTMMNQTHSDSLEVEHCPWNSTKVRDCPFSSTKFSLIACYVLILVVGTCGNILVLNSFRKKLHQSVLNLLIMYLAAFDLFASLFVPFIFGYWVWTCELEWHFGLFGCKVLPTLTRIFTSVSAGILLIMAIERCRVIIQPFKPKSTRKTIHLAVLATVIFACISETHYVMVLHLNDDGECDIRGAKTYNVMSVSIAMCRTIVFVTIFMSTTILGLCTLRSKSIFDAVSQMSKQNAKLRMRRKKNSMKMLVVMMVVFGITVIPRDLFHTCYTLSYLLPKKYWICKSPLILRINSILKILQTSNSIYNVFIYAGMYKGFIANALKLYTSMKKQYTSLRLLKKSRKESDNLSMSETNDRIGSTFRMVWTFGSKT